VRAELPYSHFLRGYGLKFKKFEWGEQHARAFQPNSSTRSSGLNYQLVPSPPYAERHTVAPRPTLRVVMILRSSCAAGTWRIKLRQGCADELVRSGMAAASYVVVLGTNLSEHNLDIDRIAMREKQQNLPMSAMFHPIAAIQCLSQQRFHLSRDVEQLKVALIPSLRPWNERPGEPRPHREYLLPDLGRRRDNPLKESRKIGRDRPEDLPGMPTVP
jgi:hypothetical protein